jgi:hypothetical protein|tara:strand:- start:200 stop:517 length:318 start_codon:yes stop_codon:yes gene_type:complete
MKKYSFEVITSDKIETKNLEKWFSQEGDAYDVLSTMVDYERDKEESVLSFDDDGTLRCSVKKLIAALYEFSDEFNCELKGEFFTYDKYDAHNYKAPKFIKEELID